MGACAESEGKDGQAWQAAGDTVQGDGTGGRYAMGRQPFFSS
jgi:hypothetical protein